MLDERIALEALRRQVTKLVDMQDQEWQDFADQWEYQKYPKGEVLTSLGDVENYFYFVAEGLIRGYALRDGEDVSIGFSYNGDFSGAYDSMLARTPSEWCMETTCPTVALRIHHQNLQSLFDRYKVFERWGREFNAQMLILMAKRQVEARSFSAEERLQRLVASSPHIFQLVSQKHIASYLGMKPETLSRLRKQQ